MSYNSAFQDRIKSSAEAKKKALEKLRAKPAPDPAVIAERQARRAAKEAAEAEKREAKRRAIEEEKAAKIAAAGAAAAAAEEEKARLEAERKAKAPPSSAELKALRDARYAARKARVLGR